ncbi:acyl-CoA-like ligand-binding transcription factor [Nocardia sp. NPDC055165]|uniref:acyl-CoA-like ligand-binding transcription factor n=1 Tax=Nocardia sp. NPDC060220 TaxID=3347076 RepID=UPI00364FDF19
MRRVGVIAANPALAERDLIKLADIANALTRALERRGIDSGEASFISNIAIAISRRATSRWLADPDATFSELIARTAAELREAVTPRAPTVR